MAHPSSKRKRQPSFFQLSVFLCFLGLQKISFKWASLVAYHFWFHPGRSAIRHIPHFKPDNTRSGKFTIAEKTVCFWSAGEGPNVLLVHGWAGCGHQLSTIAEALLDANYRVTWFDAPAHGQSTGHQTNLFEIAESILQLETKIGSFEAVVAHSFGVPCTLGAINQGMNINKLIAISTPASAASIVHQFCKAIKAHTETREHMIGRLHKAFNDKIFEQISAENLALNIKTESLVIHDKLDPIISVNEGKKVQQNLRHSSMILTEGLGHNRILRDPDVVKQCVNFITT